MTHPSFVDININNENGLLISNHGRKKVNFVLEQEILFSCSCDTFIIFITEEIFDFINVNSCHCLFILAKGKLYIKWEYNKEIKI